ncbi:MAG TPA: cytochrome P450 [Kofleriaceae bacterium]|jgi:cytochrome P450|nr:cytochrome P450 [Kofleriaceae bacterium]
MAAQSSILVAPPVVGSIPAVPGLPVVGNLLAFRKDRLALAEQAARLGPIARISFGHVPIYIVTCGELAHEVLVEHAASFRKSLGIQLLRPLLGDGLLTAEGEPHRRHRKLLAPAFAPRRLAAYGEVMVAETREQLARWSPGDRIDLAAEMMQLTLAIAGRTMFGVDVRRDASTVARAIQLGMRAVDDGITSPLQLGYRWPLPRHLRMRRAVAMLDDVVFRLIRDGRALGTDRGDVLSMLLLARDEDDGSQLADREVRDEVMTLLLAGHETTANMLSWTWYELGRHPAALARLEAEVAGVLGGRPVTTADLPALPWTAAVIDEATRLHPPVYMTGREAVREVELAGHRLPARSIVDLNLRGIHRRADYYPDPLAFRPERMLPEAKKARPRHHFLPFGAGPRVCIGAHFALMEAQLALATMAQQARFHLLAHRVAAEPLITLRPRGGMPAIVERC